jgi:predicted metal-dependent RNase
VEIGGVKLTIRARVRTLTGYSAPHAVQAGLLAWVEAMKQRPWRIKLVHGEKKAQ